MSEQHDNQNPILKGAKMGKDGIHIPVRCAGISDLLYPIAVWDRDHEQHQRTVGRFRMSIGLPHDVHRMHRSRLIEAVELHRNDMSQESVVDIVDDLRSRLNADRAHVSVTFPYFIRRNAPVSGGSSLLEVQATIEAEADNEREMVTTLRVTVPVMTLCPRAKEVTRYGAHTQRSFVTMSVRWREMVWIEDLVALADAASSSPIYPLLKREDEKWVTEAAYENPVFVEELVRNVAKHMMQDHRIMWFFVEAENEESTHNHNAYAAVASDDIIAQNS